MRLRRARPEDALRVAELHVRSWQDAYAGLLPADFLGGLDPIRRASHYAFGADPDGALGTVVAEAEDRILGFATVGATGDPDRPGAGEVYGLYVDPDCWRRGCGSLLMSDARARLAAHGFTEALLWVLEGNSRAEAFYAADGWARDGTERDGDIGPGWRAANTAAGDIPVIHESRWRRRL
jgi:GNAT superfamily N-acetyltransferase